MATQLATNQSGNPLVVFRGQLEQRASELKMVLPSHISPEKFQRTIITAVQQNPSLLGVSRQSLILACMKAAQDGVLLDGREAVVVPFKNRKKIDGQWQSIEEAAYIPMTFGIRKKVLQARDANGQPVVSGLEVGVVYKREIEEGYFIYQIGRSPPLEHRPMLDIAGEDTSDDKIVVAYSIATMADGTRSYEIMRRFEIDKVRESSQTGATRNRDGSKREPKGPWLDWFAEMCKKTVLKRHAKSLPQSGDLIIEADDDESYAGASATALLSSRGEDDPQLITDENGNTIDTDTGEVNAEQRAEAEKKLAEMQADFTKAKTDKAKAKVHERYAPWISQIEEPFRDLHERAMAAIPEYKDADETPAKTDATTQAEDPGVDEHGVTKDPNEVVAERLLGEFANAKTEADLRKLWDSSELERAPMSDELHDAVANGRARHEKRLRQAHTEPAE